MMADKLADAIDASDDPAKEFGSLEVWNGEKRYVLRNDKGHFVTWREQGAAERDATANKAIADGGQDGISFTTERGTEILVVAEAGKLFATANSSQLNFERARARLEGGYLDCGVQRTTSGKKVNAKIPVGDSESEIESLREKSKSAAELRFEVVQETRFVRVLGQREKREVKKLSANKAFAEMTENEKELAAQIDNESVPEGATMGDLLTPEELLDDARTRDEKDQDALKEAEKTGEEVVIYERTGDCIDPSKDCSLDRELRVATPSGEIEMRRQHMH